MGTQCQDPRVGSIWQKYVTRNWPTLSRRHKGKYKVTWKKWWNEAMLYRLYNEYFMGLKLNVTLAEKARSNLLRYPKNVRKEKVVRIFGSQMVAGAAWKDHLLRRLDGVACSRLNNRVGRVSHLLIIRCSAWHASVFFSACLFSRKCQKLLLLFSSQ